MAQARPQAPILAPALDRYFQTMRSDEGARPDWRSWESWLTLALVIMVQFPVVGSLQSSHWVDEMPALLTPAVVGLLSAWVIGYTRLSSLVSALLALLIGAVITTLLVLSTMVLTLPDSGGITGRWYEFRLRLLEWCRALVSEGISTDPLPFVVLMVGIVFLAAFVSTWAVVRWRNPWIALLPGGFILLTNISYLPGQPILAFVVFVFAAVLLVVRLTYLQTLDGWLRDGARPDEDTSVGVLLIGALVASLLVAAAWTIPTANNWGPVTDLWTRAFSPVNDRIDRFGQLFVGVGSKKPIPVHALGPTLPIRGEVFLSDDPLFEVVAEEPVNLRGAVYDEYTGQGWGVSSAGAVDLLGTTVEAASVGTPATRSELRSTVRIDVTVVGDGAPTAAFLAPGDPITTDAEARLLVDSAGRPLSLIPAGEEPATGETYSSVGTVSAAAIQTLLQAGTAYPQSILDRYTALPDDLSPEVAALAASITQGASTPYEAARLIETHLRQNYAFTLQVSTVPPGQDAVSHFLFESRAGYFDQFSSAMAVLLRTQGIPTRVAAGFALDERDLDPATKAYRVSEQNSWSWTEVYFPGLGWVEFNPTPSREVVARPGDDEAARSAAAADSDELFPEVFDDFIFEEEADPLSDFTGTTSIGVEDDGGRFVAILARLIGWSFVIATVLLVAILVARFWWERAFRALPVPERRWAKVQRLAGWAGLGTYDDRTPSESAALMATRLRGVEAPRGVAALARAYTRSRYGSAVVEETKEQGAEQDAHYRRVRAELGSLIRRRLVRFGRIPGGPLTPKRIAGS